MVLLLLSVSFDILFSSNNLHKVIITFAFKIFSEIWQVSFKTYKEQTKTVWKHIN